MGEREIKNQISFQHLKMKVAHYVNETHPEGSAIQLSPLPPKKNQCNKLCSWLKN